MKISREGSCLPLNVYICVLQDAVFRAHSGTILFSVILMVQEMGISGASDHDPFYLATVMRIFDMNIARDSTH